MPAPILYCGDTTLETAAAYLGGLLSRGGFEFDYCPSHERTAAGSIQGRRLVILSDYPSAQLSRDAQTTLVSAVNNGTSLLMIGGWESFHGLGGDWDSTAMAAILPVVMQTTDDRLNCDHPALIRQVGNHAVVDGLPWTERAPYVGGFNRFEVKPGSKVVLEADRVRPSFENGIWRITLVETHPLLVLGQHGNGFTAAIATDVAPHWVGGFVDWGDGRVTGQAPGAGAIEVGDLYAQFWTQLVSWLVGSRKYSLRGQE